jgi:hypothetical protein
MLACLTLLFHSTAMLDLCCNSLTGQIPSGLTGRIPSEIGLLTQLGESSVVWFLVMAIVVSSSLHCTLMLLACHLSFYRLLATLEQ